MKTRRYTEAQVFRILKEVESGIPVVNAAREHGVSPATIHRWKRCYNPRHLASLEECSRLPKHFTARDIISRWDIIDVNSRATASTAGHFLDKLEQRMPFTIMAIQVDGGSEYEAVFE